jgi:hypothetical protein
MPETTLVLAESRSGGRFAVVEITTHDDGHAQAYEVSGYLSDRRRADLVRTGLLGKRLTERCKRGLPSGRPYRLRDLEWEAGL